MKKEITNNQLGTQVAVIAEKIENIERTVGEIKNKLERDYATKEWVSAEYGQTKKIVNYILGLFGTAIVLAIIGLVIKK